MQCVMCNAHCTDNSQSLKNKHIMVDSSFSPTEMNFFSENMQKKQTNRLHLGISRIISRLGLGSVWPCDVLILKAHHPSDEDKSSILRGNASQVHF